MHLGTISYGLIFLFLYEKFSIGVRVSYLFSLFSNIQRVWAKYAQTLKLLTLITSAFLLGVKVIRMYNTARQGKKITIFFSSHLSSHFNFARVGIYAPGKQC